MVKKYNMYLTNGKKYIISESSKKQIKESKYNRINFIEFGDNIIFIAHITHIEPQKKKPVIEKDYEMDLESFIEYTKKSTSKHIQFIGDWAETTKANHIMKSQWDIYMKRHMAAASSVVKFDRSKVISALQEIKKDSNDFTKYKPTIETIIKYLTH